MLTPLALCLRRALLLVRRRCPVVVVFETAADSDTITLNGTTTGGLVGADVELIDIAADTWFVNVRTAATGTEATPFSAAVS